MKSAESTKSWSSGQELLEEARSSQSTLMEEMSIQGTPFRAVKEEGGWFGAIGQNKLTDEFETTEELITWMEENHWELLIRVITMVVQTIDLHKAKVIKELMEKEEFKRKSEHEGLLGLENLKAVN